MRSIRIHTPQPLQSGAEIELEADPARHLVRVLRARSGQRLILFNGDGSEHEAVILQTGPADRCRLGLEQQHHPARESPLHSCLVQAISRGERMDLTIRKACELGVSEIRPVFSARTEVRLKGERMTRRLEHWRKIAVAACEQSGRVRIPPIAEPVALSALAWPAGLRLHLDPQAPQALAGLLPDPGQALILTIGPEGGLDEAELGWLERQGSQGLRLGPRILRTETAGPAALAVLQAKFGDWQ